ncbi:MAG: glucokinase [Spirochaetaceae bacterium]|nr:glucokinase [Spirochaetaceae bacterium]
METLWPGGGGLRENAEYIFAGDVGGTNTSLALVEDRAGSLRVLGKFLFKTRETPSIVQAASLAKAEINRAFPGLILKKACLSVAGIVENNSCAMTNVSWIVSGPDLEKELKVPVKIINDFTAVSFALPLLDTQNPREVTRMPGSGGTARPTGGVRAVIGAGTGLGVGCLIETQTGFQALASEGGHVDFAPVDEESRGLCAWVARRIGAIPETELFVSGQGLVNAFGYFCEKARADGSPPGAAFAQIAATPDDEKPALIARFADSDPGCAQIMRLFVRMYARVAANAAVTFIPAAGLFLAGGIAAKNERWFLEDNAFMRSFSLSCKQKITALLAAIPVYIIKDYGVSLGGAANAARYLMQGP